MHHSRRRSCARWRQKQLAKKAKGKDVDPDRRLPVTERFFTTMLGVTSETYADALGKFVREELKSKTSSKGIKVGPTLLTCLKVLVRPECWAQGQSWECRAEIGVHHLLQFV